MCQIKIVSKYKLLAIILTRRLMEVCALSAELQDLRWFLISSRCFLYIIVTLLDTVFTFQYTEPYILYTDSLWSHRIRLVAFFLDIYFILDFFVWKSISGDLINFYTFNNINSQKPSFYRVQVGLKLKTVVKTTFS